MSEPTADAPTDLGRTEFLITADGQTRTVDLHTITLGEWEQIERVTGMGWYQVLVYARARRVRAVRPLWWIALRREHGKSLGYDDPRVDRPLTEIVFEVVEEPPPGAAADPGGGDGEKPDPPQAGAAAEPASQPAAAATRGKPGKPGSRKRSPWS